MSAPTLKVTGINHVVLHVTDLQRSRHFYMDVLGFEDRNLSGGGRATMSFLLCGMQGLDLFEVADGDVHGGQEMNHMALAVAADDVEQVVAALQGAGVEVSERTPRNSVFILDPDGHRLEILPRSATERARERAGQQVTAPA